MTDDGGILVRQVRLKGDPGRIGVLTGRKRDRESATLLQVLFPPHEFTFVPEDQIEFLGEAADDPLDLLKKDRLGRAVDLRRLLTHVRLTGRLANVIYSMDVTGTDFYAYQFKPVLKLLDSSSNGLVIADEVGLGKTIEAGLIWTELRARFDYRRLLVVCPAALRQKWARELRLRFGADTRIVDQAEALSTLQDAADRGASASFALVGSFQGLRPGRGWKDDLVGSDQGARGATLARFLQEHQHLEPLVDLLIIDEAHHMRNSGIPTSDLGRLLRDVSHHTLLLSATPINLRNRDLYQLLNLVDEDTFDQPRFFEEMLEANSPLIEARELVMHGQLEPEDLTQLIHRACSHPYFAGNRQLRQLLDQPPTAEELLDRGARGRLAQKFDNINLLGPVVNRTRRREVTEWSVIREAASPLVQMTPEESAFYGEVTELVREYAAGASAHEGFLLVMPQRQVSSSMPAALRYWQRRGNQVTYDAYEDLGNGGVEELEETPGPLLATLIARASQLGDYRVLRAHDSKYLALRDALSKFFVEHPTDKVVLFTYFRETLMYLAERLGEDGIKCFALMGGGNDQDAVIDSFRRSEGPSVLLSTEVGSEGIDLQFCWTVVNYDLPWNPMRVEQRIGRVDRLGQQSDKVLVINFFYEDTIDSRIYRRLLQRLRIFERALGGLEPVLGPTIRNLAIELMRNRLTPAQEVERIEQTAQALENIRQQEEELENNAPQLVAYSDYILNEVRAARELSRRIDSRDIRNYVIDFFGIHFDGCEFIGSPHDADDYRVRLSPTARNELADFILRSRLDSTTRLTRPESGSVRCRFENTAVPKPSSQVETISQFHPIVRFVTERIEKLGERFHPCSAVVLDCSQSRRPLDAGVYCFSVQRWSITGLRDIEEIHFAATRLDEPEATLDDELAETLVIDAANNGADWIGAGNEVDLARAASVLDKHCLARSDAEYSRRVATLTELNEDRADIQQKTLEKWFNRQMESLESVRRTHVARGRDSLARAQEGKISALIERYGMRRGQIESRRAVTNRKIEACIGIVKVVSTTVEEVA